MNTLTKRLVEAFGPPGREDPVRDLVVEEIRSNVDSWEVSPLGSLHAIVNPSGSTKVMLAAHLDEIGVIVSHIEERGFARFQFMGGVLVHTLVGHRVRFANGAVGVIGMETLEDKAKMPKLDQLYLDFGATSREASPVKVGDIGAFDRPFLELGERWVAKSMDDRIGVAVLIETIKRLRRTPNQLQFAFTVQEEFGIRGARTSAFGLMPDIALAVDVTATGDTPRGKKMAVELGKGPAIKVRDSGMIADPRLVDLMIRRAEQAGIPYQLEVLDAGTTDASAIQITRAGVPAGCVSIPTRYIHTPSEMVDRNDVENAVRLLLEILRKPIELKS